MERLQKQYLASARDLIPMAAHTTDEFRIELTRLSVDEKSYEEQAGAGETLEARTLALDELHERPTCVVMAYKPDAGAVLSV
jgi:hypothetical protein